jgi:hypothetical protein
MVIASAGPVPLNSRTGTLPSAAPRERGGGRWLRLLAPALFAAMLSACGGMPKATDPPPHARSMPRVDTRALVDDLERRTFDYFWETTRADNGLAPDRWPAAPFASIAAVGFALTAYPIGVERGWIDRAAAAARTRTTLEFLAALPQGDAATGTGGHRGFFYHFLDLDTGHRHAPWVELSSVDTGLLLMGVLFAQTWYDGDTPDEARIRELAERLYRRVEWPWMQPRPPRIGMGWHPETGFIDHDWEGYNEAMLVYLLALGSPTHPVGDDAWPGWTSTYPRHWGEEAGQRHLRFGPLFGHQYSHVWIDFRGIRDDWMRSHGLDYFENSRRATLAQRAYAIENPMGWRDYGADVWGLTACDGPQNIALRVDGRQRVFRHYSARGPGPGSEFDDGTLAPTAALGSLPFAPEIVLPAAQTLHDRYGEHIYGEYGFIDAFNPSFRADVPVHTGRVVPGFGWVAGDWIGIDQGPILAMIANHRDGFVWRTMQRNPHIRRGLERAGFRGGWLDATAAPPGTRGPG